MTSESACKPVRLPNLACFVVPVLAWAAVFHAQGNSVFGYAETASLFQWLWVIWNGNPDDEIGMWVPVLVGALFYRNRADWMSGEYRVWWPGLAILGVGIVLHVVGYTVQQTRLSALGFLIGVFGLAGLVWGPGFLKRTYFPYLLLVFAIPFSVLLEPLSIPLRHVATRLAVGVAHAVLGIEVQRDGVLLYNASRSFQFEVAAPCSGIHSLTAMFLLSVTFSFLSLTKPLRRLVLVGSAIPVAVLSNVIRLITIIWVADGFGQKAGSAIENKFGFVTFLLGLMGVFGAGWLLRENRGAVKVVEAAGDPESEEAV